MGRWRASGEVGIDEALADGEAETTACENLVEALNERVQEGLRVRACYEDVGVVVFLGEGHGGEQTMLRRNEWIT